MCHWAQGYVITAHKTVGNRRYACNQIICLFHHCFESHNNNLPQACKTATVAWWLEHPPHERELMGSIPRRDRSKSLKLVVVVFPHGTQDYGNSTTTGAPVSG